MKKVDQADLTTLQTAWKFGGRGTPEKESRFWFAPPALCNSNLDLQVRASEIPLFASLYIFWTLQLVFGVEIFYYILRLQLYLKYVCCQYINWVFCIFLLCARKFFYLPLTSTPSFKILFRPRKRNLFAENYWQDRAITRILYSASPENLTLQGRFSAWSFISAN